MKILIAYDGSPTADAAVSDLRKAGLPKESEALVVCVVAARVHAVEVRDFPVAPSHQPTKVELNEGRALADTASKWIQSHFPDWKVSVQVPWGPPGEMILEKIHSWHPDLLVVGSHGRSLAGRLLLGSISLKLSHEAPCSVRVVRAGTHTDHGPLRLVVGCDGSSESEAVIQEIARRSWPEKSELRIVSVVETIMPISGGVEPGIYAPELALSAIQDSLDKQRAQIREIITGVHDLLQHAGLIVAAVEIEGDPKRDLVADASRWNADAIFVGARGMSRLEEIVLGSVSTSVLKHAHCAVEIVRNVARRASKQL